MSDNAMSDVPPPADSAAAPAAAPAPAPAPAAAAAPSSAPSTAPPAATAAAAAPTTTNTDLKRKLDDGAAAQPAAAGDAQPAEKKMKTENGTPAAATPAPAAASASSTPSTSTPAPAAHPAASSTPAPAPAPAPAPSSTSTIPKKAGIPKKTGVVGAVGPKPLPKPISAPLPAPKPVAVSAAPGNVPKPAAAAASPPAASPTKGPVPKPAAAASKSASKKKEDSDSSSSESDSSSDSDSEDDRPLQKKKPAAKRAPARKPASATKKRKNQDSDSDSSSSSDSDSDSSSSSDSDSSDSSSSSDDSDSSSSSSSDSDSSASDSSSGGRRKRGVKKAPARRKPAGKKNTNPTGSRYKARRPRGDDESGSDSEEEEGFDESKVVLYPMSKYPLKENVEPLKETQGANKWWNRMQDTEDRTKWVSLDHNGMLFPPPYQPHGIPLVYDGAEVTLTPEQEEVASMWAAMLETDYVKNKTFQKNFFRDFKALFPKESVVKELAKCDFSRMAAHITNEKETAKLLRKTDPKVRAADKEEKDRLQEIYGYALVDGYKEKVGNFRVEPPNLFRGRGDHPKTGTLKRRVQPEDVIINIGMGMAVPPPPPGRTWRGIIHNNKVTWLAFYRDNVNGDFKYIWLAPSSRFKGESDIKKYTKAQKLKKYIDEIRKNYRKEMKSPHSQFRQRATAIYLIDFLALRVGNEKDKNEVADTVGCCSLRVEHLSFSDNNTVTFDFLGKDSMRYYNTVELDEQAYKNLKSFCEKKKPKDEVFGDLTTTLLNEHLKSLMPELTAKVFRTYNASITLEQELNKNDVSPDEHITTKVNYYNAANREVAILCNHQKTVSKGHESAIGKLKEQLEALYDDRDELVDWIEELTEKKGKKDAKAAREHRANERAERRKHRLQKARDAAKAKKEKAKEERAKLRAAGKEIPPSDQEEEDEDYGVKEKAKPKPTDVKKAETALARLQERIVNFEAKLTLRDQNKEVALGTSKINYMDPRITVAWCKRKEVPLEMVFNKSLVTKFPWAMEVPSDWKF